MLNLLYAPGLGKLGMSKIQAEARAILSRKMERLVWSGKEFDGLTDEMAAKIVANASIISTRTKRGVCYTIPE